MNFILPDKGDILFIYIEQWFTGFAPCFEKNIYSLACCMGRKDNGGMKATACKLNSIGRNVWILSIAGKNIGKTEKNGRIHNCTNITYSQNDMIYLAKVENTFTWEEYYEKYKGRRDAIYCYNGETMECVNLIDHTINNAPTDCALKHKDYRNLKQILTSNHYYIFKSGNKLPDNLVKNRNGAYKKNNPELLRDYIKESSIAYFCKNPFIITDKFKGGCKK